MKSEQPGKQRAGIVGWWEWLVSLDTPDEEKARVGRVFNIVLVITVGVVTGIALIFWYVHRLGMGDFPLWLAVALPLSFIPVSIVSMIFVKRGYVRAMLQFYVWSNFAGISVAVLMFDGHLSPGVMLYFWTVSIAGTLLSPNYALGMTGGVGVFVFVLGLLTRWGVYRPLFTLGLEGRHIASIYLAVLMLFSSTGLLTFLNVRALQQALNRLRSTTGQLGEQQRTLERQVQERTRELAHRARYLEATATVAAEMTLVLDEQDLLDRVVALISEQFDFYHAGIFVLDQSGEWAVLAAVSSEGGRRMLSRGHRLRVGQEGIVGNVADRGEPRIVMDVKVDPEFVKSADLPDTQSEVALPLKARGDIIGVLDVQSATPEMFGEQEAIVLQTLADQIAVAISNARLFQRVEASLEAERRAYGQLTQGAWQEMLRKQPDLGVVRDERGTWPAGGVWRPAMQEVLQTGQVTRVDASLGTPITVRGQVIGAISARKPDGDAWSEQEIELMTTLAQELNDALDNARLYQDTQRRELEQRLIGEVTARMRATLDVDTVLRTAMREIGEMLDLSELVVRIGPPQTLIAQDGGMGGGE